jgi:hypothetical protein
MSFITFLFGIGIGTVVGWVWCNLSWHRHINSANANALRTTSTDESWDDAWDEYSSWLAELRTHGVEEVPHG